MSPRPFRIEKQLHLEYNFNLPVSVSCWIHTPVPILTLKLNTMGQDSTRLKDHLKTPGAGFRYQCFLELPVLPTGLPLHWWQLEMLVSISRRASPSNTSSTSKQQKPAIKFHEYIVRTSCVILTSLVHDLANQVNIVSGPCLPRVLRTVLC